MTFFRVAESATHEDKKQRNRANARKAYDSVLHYLPDTVLTEDQVTEIKLGLEELRLALQSLGEEI